ncbi:MAG: hypothetical protein U1E51_28145 [Candidatus Binatia bacterium]|nr:hypothetical protein [Candidatus Binatia bacterium]
MDIFGLTFSASDLWLLAIVGVLSMWALNNYIAPNIKRRQEAAVAFQRAFDGVLLNLRENPDCPLAQIAFGFHNEHLTAITKFRDYVSFWRIRSFDRAVAHYKEAYDIACEHGSVFALALSEKTDIARAKRQHYSEAIDRLLSHA